MKPDPYALDNTGLTDEAISWHTAYAGYGSDRVAINVEHVEVNDCRNIERELKTMIAMLTAERDAAVKDAERLDFVLKQQAFIYEEPPKMPYPGLFQLWTQDEDENFNVISGDGKWFKTPRDAIDAAMESP